MSRDWQPLCPIRGDQECMGERCAWSVPNMPRSEGQERVAYTCAVAGMGHGRAVIDMRDDADQTCTRLW